MTPLEAARAMGQGNYCRCSCDYVAHDADCPVPMLPKIVAALEAAQVFVESEEFCEDGMCTPCQNLKATLGGGETN